MVLAALLAGFICLGSAFLWIGIPVGSFWLAGQLTESSTGFLFMVLAGVPLAMVGFGWLLYRLNRTYERLRGVTSEGGSPRPAWLTSLSDERKRLRGQRVRRSLIDVAMTASAIAALAILLVWFFGFAHMHLAPMQ